MGSRLTLRATRNVFVPLRATPARAAAVARAIAAATLLLIACSTSFAPSTAVADAPSARADAAAPFMPLHEPLERYPQTDVKIASGAKTHTFRVWIADTPARREQGLMWIRSLAADRGMLFVFEQPQPMSFWMKNTYVSLDLLFIAQDGRVIRIAENAKPQTLATIDSLGLALAVLEVKAGTAKRLGLKQGDKLVQPTFGPARG